MMSPERLAAFAPAEWTGKVMDFSGIDPGRAFENAKLGCPRCVPGAFPVEECCLAFLLTSRLTTRSTLLFNSKLPARVILASVDSSSALLGVMAGLADVFCTELSIESNCTAA